MLRKYFQFYGVAHRLMKNAWVHIVYNGINVRNCAKNHFILH